MADITYIRLRPEFVYLAVILDGFSRKVVGWKLDRTLASRLPTKALQDAIRMRQPPAGLVHYSDRGIQYLFGGIRGGSESVRDRAQHEPAGESIRQRELRELLL